MSARSSMRREPCGVRVATAVGSHSGHKEGWQRSTTALAEVLQHFVADDEIAVANCELAADLFLSLVIGRQTRLAMFGIETDPVHIDQRIQAAVHLFLEGAGAR